MTTELRRILHAAIEHEASDILLSVGSVPALRVDGDLRPLKTAQLAAANLHAMVEELLPEPRRAHFVERRQLDFVVEVLGRRLRGSVIHASGEPSIALRLLPDRIPNPQALGLPQVLVDALHDPWGLMLATGPAGSGKTTTVASLVGVINARKAAHIMTVEDPIEYLHTPEHGIIDQQEVGLDCDSFGAALRQILRHNPDVIVIGEIRDRETAEAALTIAETGHLVLSTVHANDAIQALDRIISLFPRGLRDYAAHQLGMVTNVIVNQRLVKGSGGGRVLAAEVLRSSSAVAHLIREGRTSQLHSVLERERGNGSQSMNWALEQLVREGKILATEARRHINRFESNRAVDVAALS